MKSRTIFAVFLILSLFGIGVKASDDDGSSASEEQAQMMPEQSQMLPEQTKVLPVPPPMLPEEPQMSAEQPPLVPEQTVGNKMSRTWPGIWIPLPGVSLGSSSSSS